MKCRSVTGNIILFTFEPSDDKRNCYTVHASSVIDILNNPDREETIPDGFYLVCSAHSILKIGTILEILRGVTFSVENNCRIKDGNELKAADVLGIEKDEMVYLMKVSIEKRVKNHELGIFAKIKNLIPGSKCLYKNEKWTIVSENVKSDGIKFTLENSTNKAKRLLGIDASKIELDERVVDKVPSNPEFKRQNSIQNSLPGTGRGEQKAAELPSTLEFPAMKLIILNPVAIKKIDSEQSRQFNKFIVIHKRTKDYVVKLLWKGIVDDKICLGVDLMQDCADGTDGKFLEEQLFTCEMGRGALIPVNQDKLVTCESDRRTHNNLFANDIIKESEICCLEMKMSLESAGIEIGNSVVYGKDRNKRGIANWLGLVNGKKCVGIVCEDGPKKYKTGGIVHQTGWFTDQLDKIAIMHITSVKSEKLVFIRDKIVDLQNIFKAETVHWTWVTNDDFNGINIGDPVATEISGKQFIGEAKWLGIINNEKCVGLDMKDRFQYGMNGEITDAIKFKCLEGHGLVTLLSNVKLSDKTRQPKLLENGIIDARKLLKCEEKWHQIFLKEKKIKKGDLVSIKMNSNGDVKLKGTLRWCGFMNGMPVGAVELTEDHENGTDGTFWRNQLFRCSDKRAIAISWNRIIRDITLTETIENMELEIISPQIRDLKVKPLRFDSKNLILKKDRVKLLVTLLWKGEVDDHLCIGCELNSYLGKYGINGKFDSKELFQCKFGQGLLIKLNDDIDTCERHQIHKESFAALGILDPNGICCFKACDALSQHPNIRIGDQVAMKAINVTCKWIGLVNNTEAIMIEDELTIRGNKLPKCKLKDSKSASIEGIVVIADIISPYSPVNFEKETFAKNHNKFTHWKKLGESGNYRIGELVQVGLNPVFYGKIQFFIERLKEVLVGIQLDADQMHTNHEFLKEIRFEEILFEKGNMGIIVKVNKLEKFNAKIELERDSCFIKKNSIKYKTRFPLNDFLKNEVVQSTINSVEYFMIIDSLLINEVPCFAVKKGIMADEPDAIEYLTQKDVRKIKSIPTTHYADTIINPRSLLTFEKWEDENLKIGDKVVFKLKTLYSIQGTIKWIGKANGVVPSSVVELV